VHFYDLNAVPATCPKCSHAFDPSVSVRAKRKTAKRAASDVEIAISPAMLAEKKNAHAIRKQKKDASEEDGGEGVGGLMEMEDMDEVEALHELSELEEMEESSVNEDDVDEEALIEELDTGGNAIIGNVEDEEAIAFVEEIGEDGPVESAKKKKAKK
jgi:hypothetical protein